MKKLYILAALLMASTAAHAGNSISFDIEGHHIQVAVPRNCSSLSCLKISAPGVSGSNFFKSKHSDDDDNYADGSPAPAPVQKHRPRSSRASRRASADGAWVAAPAAALCRPRSPPPPRLRPPPSSTL